MTALETRKQLLIAQSELNRNQMLGDLMELGAGIDALNTRNKSMGSIVTSAAELVSGIVGYQRGKTRDAARNTTWVQTALKGTGLLCTLWLAIRSRNGSSK